MNITMKLRYDADSGLWIANTYSDGYDTMDDELFIRPADLDATLAEWTARGYTIEYV
jgi:hypothetical protein